MRTHKALLAGALCLALVLAVCPPGAKAANILDGAWFKLKLTVKGYKFVPDTGEYEKYNFSAPAYIHLVWDTLPEPDRYRIEVWTLKDGVWTKYYQTYENTIRDGENFFKNNMLVWFYFTANDYIGTYHTPFINIQKDAGGALKKATWQETGMVRDGCFDNNTKTFRGYFNLTGATVTPDKLPFTPP